MSHYIPGDKSKKDPKAKSQQDEKNDLENYEPQLDDEQANLGSKGLKGISTSFSATKDKGLSYKSTRDENPDSLSETDEGNTPVHKMPPSQLSSVGLYTKQKTNKPQADESIESMSFKLRVGYAADYDESSQLSSLNTIDIKLLFKKALELIKEMKGYVGRHIAAPTPAEANLKIAYNAAEKAQDEDSIPDLLNIMRQVKRQVIFSSEFSKTQYKDKINDLLKPIEILNKKISEEPPEPTKPSLPKF